MILDKINDKIIDASNFFSNKYKAFKDNYFSDENFAGFWNKYTKLAAFSSKIYAKKDKIGLISENVAKYTAAIAGAAFFLGLLGTLLIPLSIPMLSATLAFISGALPFICLIGLSVAVLALGVKLLNDFNSAYGPDGIKHSIDEKARLAEIDAKLARGEDIVPPPAPKAASTELDGSVKSTTPVTKTTLPASLDSGSSSSSSSSSFEDLIPTSFIPKPNIDTREDLDRIIAGPHHNPANRKPTAKDKEPEDIPSSNSSSKIAGLDDEDNGAGALSSTTTQERLKQSRNNGNELP